jgi:hypothetical protein
MKSGLMLVFRTILWYNKDVENGVGRKDGYPAST